MIFNATLRYMVVASLLALNNDVAKGFFIGTSTHSSHKEYTQSKSIFSPSRKQFQSSTCIASSSSGQDEAQKLLEKATKIRKELAELEGKLLAQVEKEANDEKESLLKLQQEREASRMAMGRNGDGQKRNRSNSQVIYLPKTIDDQIRQASFAIQRTFEDHITRQTVRLALVKQDGPITPEEEEWPSDSKQI